MIKNRYMVYYRCPNCLINFRAFTSHTGFRNCRKCSQSVRPHHVVSKWNNSLSTKFRIRWYFKHVWKKINRTESQNALAHVFLNGLPAGHIHGKNVWDVEQHQHQQQQTKVQTIHSLFFIEEYEIKKSFETFILIYTAIDFLYTNRL